MIGYPQSRKRLGVPLVLLLSLSFFALLTAPPALAQDVSGDWYGYLEASQAKLRLVLHVQPEEGGEYSATLDSPDQGQSGIALDAITVE